MICSLSENALYKYVISQLQNYYPDDYQYSKEQLMPALLQSLERIEKCFAHVTLPGYHKEGQVFFNHMHSDQYSQFLYFLGNTLYKMGGDQGVCSRLLNLNRVLSGMFVSYKCELPGVFLFCHAVGTVIGNASYNDYLVVFQNVTINTSKGSEDPTPPKIGRGVFLGAGAKIIGNKSVGNYVSVGVDAHVYDIDIPDNSVVKNIDGKSVVCKRKREKCHAQTFFDIDI